MLGRPSFKSRIASFLRRHFVSGLLVWAPLIVTVMVITFLIDLLDKTLLLLPLAYRPDHILGTHIPGFGVILSLVVLLATGFLAANVIGGYLLSCTERIWNRIPLVRTIYSAVKQVMETVVSPSGQAFRKVVMVEWPRRDMWTVAFVTTNTTHSISLAVSGKELVNVFVPATPNITSGFLMMVEKQQIRELDIGIEEALKLIVSLGVVQGPTLNHQPAKQAGENS